MWTLGRGGWAASSRPLIHGLWVPHREGGTCSLHTRQRQLRELMNPSLKNGLLVRAARIIEDDCGRVCQSGFHHRHGWVSRLFADICRRAIDQEEIYLR